MANIFVPLKNAAEAITIVKWLMSRALMYWIVLAAKGQRNTNKVYLTITINCCNRYTYKYKYLWIGHEIGVWVSVCEHERE